LLFVSENSKDGIFQSFLRGSHGSPEKGELSSLFSYTKTRKDPTQQIFTAKLTGNLRKRALRLTQFLCEQFTGVAFPQLPLAVQDRILCTVQRIEMTAAGGEDALGYVLITGAPLEVYAQQI
jgi:hypothetical protein